MKKLLLFLSLFVFLLSCNNSNDNNAADNEVDDIETEEVEEPSSAFLETSFTKLFAFYEKDDSTFDTKNFEEAQVTPIDSVTAYPVNPQQLEEFYPYFIYNSDSTYAIDLYSYNYVLSKRNDKLKADQSGPDTEVALIDVKKGTRKRIFFSGPAISLLDAKWLDNNTILLAGVETGEGNTSKPIILKADLNQNNIQWFVHNKSIETDFSNYVEENVFNKLN